jgi:hypothetical protein
MNPFTEHTEQQGVSYWEHWGFAMGISYRLLISVIAFALHAIFPFISIDSSNDLEATATFLNERNHWIETVEKPGKEKSQPIYPGITVATI